MLLIFKKDNFFKQADEESYLVLTIKNRIRKDKLEPRSKHKSRNKSSHGQSSTWNASLIKDNKIFIRPRK